MYQIIERETITMAKVDQPPMKLYSAAEFAIEHVRHLINSGALAYGEKLVVEELAAQIGTSTTPVRDALQQLKSEGLVEIVPRVGVYVREIPVAEVCEVYAVKQALEPLMVAWATEHGSKAERESFAESSKELLTIAETGNVDAYVDLIEKRRIQLVNMSKSAVLEVIFRSIDGRVRWLRHRNLSTIERMKESALQHMDIASAVLDGDAIRASLLSADHVETATTRLKILLDTEEPPIVSSSDYSAGAS